MPNHFRDASARKLRVFLCHVSEDKPVVRGIYQKLQSYNIYPWLDEKDLLPGENWAQLIPEVIRECDIVLLCLSHAFLTKESYGNYELRVVLEVAKRKPFNTIYHIPFRLDDCEVPSFLAEVHYASNFVPEDFNKLLIACEKRREWLNTTQALNIAPIGQQVLAEPLNPYAGPARLQRSLLSAGPGRQGFPNKKASTSTTSDKSVRVEHFDIGTSQNPISVFLSYVHEDEWLLNKLEAHLSGLKREGLISTWCDRQIMPGSHWAGVVDQHLEQASLILLLVSSDFLDSDYCYQIEIKRALERDQAGKAIVIPVIVRPTDWQKTPLAHLEPLPAGGRPVTDWGDFDQAFVNVVAGIRQVVEALASQSLALKPTAWPTAGNEPAESSLRGTRTQEEPSRFASQKFEVDQQSSLKGTQTARESDADTQRVQGASSPRSANAQPFREPPKAGFGAPFPPLWNVPRRHNAFFTGRESVLDHLFGAFRVENTANMISPQAITGLGGMGKTQIAAEYAYRFREVYQAVLWVRADTQESLLADFRAIAGMLKRPQKLLEEQQSLVQTMHEWFRSHSDWLLIFDNADDPGLVHPFFPYAGRGHVLTTTRAGAIVELAQPYYLEKLEIEAGALCILRRAGQLSEQQHLSDAPSARVDAACKLADMMKGLPLALEQAGAYINDTDCGVLRYLKLYEKYRAEIRSQRYGMLPDYPEAVVSAWKISRSMVEHSNPAAAELLCLCAFLDPDAIPDELVLNGASALGPVLGPVAGNDILFDQAISILKRYSLLHREVDRETEQTKLSIHRIMQEILLDEMDAEAQQLWAGRAVCAVDQTFKILSDQGLSDPWPLLQTHARKCQLLIEQWHMNFPEAERLQKWIEKFER